MYTWEVIKFLTENTDSDKVFISKQHDRVYDIYLDNCTKEFFIDEKLNGTDNWIYKTELKNYEFSKILHIKNWEQKVTITLRGEQ
jgi:ubiquitin C-terminal hydrolase